MQYERANLLLIAALLLVPFKSVPAADVVALAEQQTQAVPDLSSKGAEGNSNGYLVQPGDLLHVSVWHEPDLQLDVLVSPGGNFSMPLIGQLQATDKSLKALQLEIAARLEKFVPGADVMVALKQIQGNKVYVIGKVIRPGEFVLNRNVDVMQALSMAGGMTEFADAGDIIILRREEQQAQRVYAFDYDEVKKGNNLAQNIILKSGDVIVVP